MSPPFCALQHFYETIFLLLSVFYGLCHHHKIDLSKLKNENMIIDKKRLKTRTIKFKLTHSIGLNDCMPACWCGSVMLLAVR